MTRTKASNYSASRFRGEAKGQARLSGSSLPRRCEASPGSPRAFRTEPEGIAYVESLEDRCCRVRGCYESVLRHRVGLGCSLAESDPQLDAGQLAEDWRRGGHPGYARDSYQKGQSCPCVDRARAKSSHV